MRYKSKIKQKLEDMNIEDRKAIRRLEYKTLSKMPPKLLADYQALSFKEKLFIPYYFQTQTNTGAAIMLGYPERSASVSGSAIFQKTKHIIKFIEDVIVDKLTTRVIRTNIISKEMIVEKLALMFLADFGDLEDYEEAKKNGMIAAAKEIEIRETKDEFGNVIGRERIITKMVDQRQIAETIASVLGYKAPTKSEITGVDGTPLPPTINVVMNQISSPIKPGDDAIPVDVGTRSRTIQISE